MLLVLKDWIIDIYIINQQILHWKSSLRILILLKLPLNTVIIIIAAISIYLMVMGLPHGGVVVGGEQAVAGLHARHSHCPLSWLAGHKHRLLVRLLRNRNLQNDKGRRSSINPVGLLPNSRCLEAQHCCSSRGSSACLLIRQKPFSFSVLRQEKKGRRPGRCVSGGTAVWSATSFILNKTTDFIWSELIRSVPFNPSTW